ncbi:MAG: serine/threonine dehydratase [Rickettsiaceae bacterium]|nr:MAG: serine/threonine dehydratase [Rickettsiaceae bacterium]
MNYISGFTNTLREAHHRIKPYIHTTPILTSEILNSMLKAEIYFKAESLQKTGAFKVRGVLNHLLSLQQDHKLPTKVVAYSTGNHGIGLAYAAKILKIHARIYLPKDTARIKQQAAEYYEAEVIYTNTRQEAENLSKLDVNNGFYHMHPSDNDLVIAGAGTTCLEALEQLNFKPDAIFASCGGGGLLSGTYLAKEALSPSSLLIGCEPEQANDAYQSMRQGKIYRFHHSPDTVADGLRTLGLSERTFNYIKKLDKFFLVSEHNILYWTAWLAHLLNIACEPSCALNMNGVQQWLSTQKLPKKILVIISGGNIDPCLYQKLQKEDYLLRTPYRR